MFLWLFCNISTVISSDVRIHPLSHTENLLAHPEKEYIFDDSSSIEFKNDTEDFIYLIKGFIYFGIHFEIDIINKILAELIDIINDNSIPIFLEISQWRKKKINCETNQAFFEHQIENPSLSSLLNFIGILRNIEEITKILNYFVDFQTHTNFIDILILFLNFCEDNIDNGTFEQDLRKIIRSLLYWVYKTRQEFLNSPSISEEISLQTSFFFQKFLKQQNSQINMRLIYRVGSKEDHFIVFYILKGDIQFESPGYEVARLDCNVFYLNIYVHFFAARELDAHTFILEHSRLNIGDDRYILTEIHSIFQEDGQMKYRFLSVSEEWPAGNQNALNILIVNLIEECYKGNGSFFCVYKLDPDPYTTSFVDQVEEWTQKNLLQVKNFISMAFL